MSPPERDIADDDDRLTPAEREIVRRRSTTPASADRSRRATAAQRSVKGYLTGSAPPRWMERVMEIDAGVARVRRELAQERRELRERCGDDAAASRDAGASRRARVATTPS